MPQRVLVLPGLTQVVCPVCRAQPGRTCTNRRGYKPDGGFHRQRRALWLQQERDEARARERA